MWARHLAKAARSSALYIPRTGRVSAASVFSSSFTPAAVTSAQAAAQRTFATVTDEFGEYTGGHKVPYTSKLTVDYVDSEKVVPAFQVLNMDGTVRADAPEVDLDEETAVAMYKYMVRIQVMDLIMYDVQRQGRVSFYMTATGEEGIHMGSAAALDDDDEIFAQYREVGILMWRGFTLQQITDQCCSNKDDLGKGRQMPIHYGSKDLKYYTISSPLATQIPQAAGAAYRLKLAGKDNVVVCYFGEGAASEGDFHAALNVASTRECPVVFFCRNNGYAISTPVTEQFRGDGVISRAAGYGMPSLRVDGNDPLAVYLATKEARRIAVENKQPVLLEAMTYRQGHHSTSDDSTAYRDIADVEFWRDNVSAIGRMKAWLEAQDWWSDEKDVALRKAERKALLTALTRSEKKAPPPASDLFTDVYDELPKHLLEQEEALLAHVAKYPDQYKLGH